MSEIALKLYCVILTKCINKYKKLTVKSVDLLSHLESCTYRLIIAQRFSEERKYKIEYLLEQ